MQLCYSFRSRLAYLGLPGFVVLADLAVVFLWPNDEKKNGVSPINNSNYGSSSNSVSPAGWRRYPGTRLAWLKPCRHWTDVGKDNLSLARRKAA